MQCTYFSHRRLSIICAKTEASTKADRYHIIKCGFVPCPSHSSNIRLNAYSARAQNMCSAHIFKLLIMYAARNMCRTHIFKVVYMRCPHFLADAYAFPNRPVLRTSHIHSAKFQYYGISNNTILSVKDRLLLNIIVFTPNFPISQLRKIPVLWNFRQRDFEREKQTFAKYPCFHAEFSYQPAAQNSGIPEFVMAYFCARMTDFCQISLLSRSIFLFAPAAKFQYYGISNNAILIVKNRLLLNIIVFTLNFSISLQHKIP